VVAHVLTQRIDVEGLLDDGVGEPLAEDIGIFILVLFEYVTDHEMDDVRCKK
jgi:hypothetical protein